MLLPRPVPAVCVAVAALLTGGLVAPASAAPAQEAPPTQALVIDGRGDAKGQTPRLERLADLTRVRYRMPSTREGTMTVRARWTELASPRRGDGLRQGLVVFVDTRTGARDTSVAVGPGAAPVRIFLVEQGDEVSRVHPDAVRLSEAFGRGGATTVTVSTEWLTASRVRVSTGALVQGRGGFGEDETRERRLRVGPVG